MKFLSVRNRAPSTFMSKGLEKIPKKIKLICKVASGWARPKNL